MSEERSRDDISVTAEALIQAAEARTAGKTALDRSRGMQILSDALDAQRNRAEDLRNAATSEMRSSWVAGRDADRRVTATKHEPERRRR
jgi:hypothetical protein